MLYLDSSALVKQVVAEAESASLLAFLVRHPEATLTSSALARVEVSRAHAVAPDKVAEVLAGVDLIAVSRSVLDLAATLGPPVLRTLDAIHLASAVRLRADLTAFVAYDRRLLDAAEALGLPIASPT